MKFSRLIVAPLLLLALIPSAQAGLFDDEEARKRIDGLKQELDVRLQQLDARTKQLDGMPQSLLAVNSQIEQLRQDIAKLRGQLEVITNDLDQAQKRQKDFYVDLDTRLRKLETQPAKQAEPIADAGNEAREYEAAINALRGGRPVDAAFNFRSFIKAYPKSTFLPGAHFWAATAHLQARDAATAKDFFTKMYTDWPDDPLAPDAMLGAANAQEALKEVKGARSTLELLVATYPQSDAAKSAKQKLGKK